MVFYTKNLLNLGISTILFSVLMMRGKMLPNHFNSDWSASDNAVSGPRPKLFASNCSDCTKTCTTHPLATILSSDDDIVVTINWSSLRTCANFVSLIKHRKGSKITSFVFSRNGQWGTYQKTKTNYRGQYLVRHKLMVLLMLIIFSVKKILLIPMKHS